METLKLKYWEDDGVYLGYLEDFPAYMSQGMTIEELRENLRDIYTDLTSGEIPAVRSM